MLCHHHRTDTTPRGNTFCLDCGMQLAVDSLYYAALEDSRVLLWHKLADRPAPANAPFYAAIEAARDVWQVVRVPAGRKAPAEAAYWCPDLLGLPFAA